MCIVYMLAARLFRCSRNGAASLAFVHRSWQMLHSFMTILDENNAQQGFLAKVSSEQRALAKSGCEVRQSKVFFWEARAAARCCEEKVHIAAGASRRYDNAIFWFWFGEVDREVSLARARSIVFGIARICSLFRKSGEFACMLCRTGDDGVPYCGKQ